jgi:hypothetical protein
MSSIWTDPLRGKVSPLKQWWHKWQAARNVPFRKKFFVGYDLDGNTYWEFKNHNDPYRMRRIVEYRLPRLNLIDHKIVRKLNSGVPSSNPLHSAEDIVWITNTVTNWQPNGYNG